jgi:hypothetical protein
MILPISFLFLSYALWHKKIATENKAQASNANNGF